MFIPVLSLFVFIAVCVISAILSDRHEGRARRKRVDEVLPHLKTINRALFSSPGHFPSGISIIRSDASEAVRLRGRVGEIDYLFTRVVDMKADAGRFHVELTLPGSPPEFIMTDLDWGSEATELLADIFDKHRRFFEEMRPKSAGNVVDLDYVRDGDAVSRN